MAAGLLVAGPVLLGAALWVPEVDGWPWKEFEELRDLPDGLVPYLLVPGIMLAIVAGYAWFGRDAADLSRRVVPGLLALATVWPVWWAVPEAVEELGEDLPYLAAGAFAGGAAAMLAGALVLVAVGLPNDDPVKARRSTRALAAAGGTVLGLASLLISGLVVWPGQGDGSTAQAVQAAPVPGGATRAAWTWQVPDNRDVRQVAAAGAGVVVRTPYGVHALDGRTGKERWNHSPDTGRLGELHVSPGGGTVVLTQSAYDGRLIVLDAMTGEVRTQIPGVRLGVDETSPTGFVTDHVAADRHGPDGRIIAYDLTSGEQRWTFDPPDGCEEAGDPGSETVGPNTVVVQLSCGDDDRFVGLDDRTGRERWRHTLPEDEEIEVTASADGGRAVLSWRRDSEDGEATGNRLLDIASGKVRADEKRLPDRPVRLVGKDWLLTEPDVADRATRTGTATRTTPGGGRGQRLRVPVECFEREVVAAAGDPLCLRRGHDPAPGLDIASEVVTLNGRGAEPVAVNLGPIVDARYDYAELPEPFLVPAPGAVVAAHPGAGRVVGLSEG